MNAATLPDGQRIPWSRAFGTLGGRLRFYREQRDMTREDVAHLVRRSTSSVRRWETGVSEPSVAMLARLATTLRTPLVQLLPPDVRAPVVQVDDTGTRQDTAQGLQTSLLDTA